MLYCGKLDEAVALRVDPAVNSYGATKAQRLLPPDLPDPGSKVTEEPNQDNEWDGNA
jgi:hypothetical protein